jgi:hypothetical protein
VSLVPPSLQEVNQDLKAHREVNQDLKARREVNLDPKARRVHQYLLRYHPDLRALRDH